MAVAPYYWLLSVARAVSTLAHVLLDVQGGAPSRLHAGVERDSRHGQRHGEGEQEDAEWQAAHERLHGQRLQWMRSGGL